MAPLLDFEQLRAEVCIRNTFLCTRSDDEESCEQPSISRSKTQPSALRRGISLDHVDGQQCGVASFPTMRAVSRASAEKGLPRKRASFNEVVEEEHFADETTEGESSDAWSAGEEPSSPHVSIMHCVTRDAFESPVVWGELGCQPTFGDFFVQSEDSSGPSQEAAGRTQAEFGDALAQQGFGCLNMSSLVDYVAMGRSLDLSVGCMQLPIAIVPPTAFPRSPLGMFPQASPSVPYSPGPMVGTIAAAQASQAQSAVPEDLVATTRYSAPLTGSPDGNVLTTHFADVATQESFVGAAPSAPSRKVASKKHVGEDVALGQQTTVMLRNLPNNYTRENLLEMIDSEGFGGRYDFLYFPIDFRTHAALGYAFLNLVTPEDAEEFRRRINGFSRWSLPSSKVCSVAWSQPHQGLESHIQRYRNSPLMHDSVPDSYRPVLFSNGVRIAFPAPTKRIKPPRQGTERMLV